MINSDKQISTSLTTIECQKYKRVYKYKLSLNIRSI